jgi:hypothetical protein
MSTELSLHTLMALNLEASAFLKGAQELPVGSDLSKKAAAARGFVFNPPLACAPSGPMPNNGRFDRDCYYTKVTLAEKINSLIRFTLGLKLETWLSETHATEMHEYIKAHKDRVAEISATKGVAPDQADELATIAVRLVSNLRKVIEHLRPRAN